MGGLAGRQTGRRIGRWADWQASKLTDWMAQGGLRGSHREQASSSKHEAALSNVDLPLAFPLYAELTTPTSNLLPLPIPDSHHTLPITRATCMCGALVGGKIWGHKWVAQA